MWIMEDRDPWTRNIKQLRLEHDIGLFEAERIVLADPRWRRWVERRINTDAQCRRMALAHIRGHGADALITMVGDRLKISSGNEDSVSPRSAR